MSHASENEEILRSMDINAMWYLCLYMNALGVSCEEEDGGRVLFSKNEKAYYYHSNHSPLALDNSGYIKMRTLKELLEQGRKENLKQAS